MDGELVDLGLDMNELKELHRLNKEMIASLEDDIRICQEKLKLFGPEAELLQNLNVIQRPDGTTNIEELKDRLYNDMQNLEGRVNETAKLTGISIVQVTESTELTDDSSKRSINLSLRVLGRDVVLRCEIDDVLPESGPQESGGGLVSWLEVQIEKEINDVIGEDLAKSTQEVAVHSVLCLIKSYLQSLADRDKMIQNLTHMYPEYVRHWIQAHTHKLKINSGDAKHPTFVLEWHVKLLPSTRYVNDVILKVEASQELKALDSKGVLDSASDMFAHMVKSMGLEKAISSFISMVLSEGKELRTNEEEGEQSTHTAHDEILQA